MKPKQKLLEQLIDSLKNEPEKWEFDKHTALNNDWGISLWIGSTPFPNSGVYRPTEISFSFFQTRRLYKAISQCRATNILMKRNKG